MVCSEIHGVVVKQWISGDKAVAQSHPVHALKKTKGHFLKLRFNTTPNEDKFFFFPLLSHIPSLLNLNESVLRFQYSVVVRAHTTAVKVFPIKSFKYLSFEAYLPNLPLADPLVEVTTMLHKTSSG